MLNWCIARKCLSGKNSGTRVNLEGQKVVGNLQSNTRNSDRPSSGRSSSDKPSSAGDDSSDDEFFEALEDQGDSDEDSSLDVVVSDSATDKSQTERGTKSNCAEGGNQVREGALRRCGDLRLLVTGEPLYVPVTQVWFK